MKKFTSRFGFPALIFLMSLLTGYKSMAQQPYECKIQNINLVSPTVMEFDVYIKNTGTATLQLNGFQGGIDFNYVGMAGAGTITGAFVAGSNTLPAPQNAPNWNINATSKQIRLIAALVTSSSVAAPITSSPLKLGTFRMTNTVPFTSCSTPDFSWSFITAANKTKTGVTAWVNGGTSPVTITSATHAAATFANGGGPQHYVASNPAITCCPSSATYVSTDPLCYGGQGSASVTITGATSATSGTYTLDGGSSQTFSGNPFTVNGISTGSHTIVITPSGCTPINLSVSIGGPTSPIVNTTTITACGSYTWSLNGTTYTASGVYSSVSTNSNGCTVTDNLNLTINPSSTTTISACNSYTWSCNNQTYTSSGTYTCGCNTLNLTINQSTSSTTTATACDSYLWSVNGLTYAQSGTYTNTSTNAAGCPHTATLNLTINNSTTSTTTATACSSYTWISNGVTYTQSGVYNHGSINAAGCTNVDVLFLTINSPTSNTSSATACDSYTWGVNGMTYTSSGTYTSTGTNASGCPHTETLNLTINSSTSSSMSAVACGSYTWSCNGQTYTQSGTYTCTGTNASGCPDTKTLNLTINSNVSATQNATACDTYTWGCNGQTYTQSGTYTCNTTGSNGCPSVITLNLTINNSTSNTSSATACNSYTWAVNGQTYTTSGTYTSTGMNASGCSHTETLNLLINQSSSSSTSATACDNYTWTVNGQVYTTSGTYTYVSTNSFGCPHTSTLNLTINSSTSNSSSATACDSYTWAVNGTTYTTSGTYTNTSTNASGCPYTQTLVLTINSSTSHSTSATACDSYTWSLNGQTYTTSGTYSVTSTNAAGCSHIETLNLTINNSTSTSVNQTACNSYTWSCNGQTYTQSGIYTCTGTNAAGCTLTTTLNLTINNNTSSTTSATACSSYLWSCNNQMYTQSGTYTCTGTNASGCSHVTTLTLTINNCNGPLPYECTIQNIHQVSPTVMEFDIYIKNNGINSLKLNAFQGGIDFNYTGMAGAGTITGAFVTGSNSLPAPQNNPNWNINATSKQIRLIASVVTSSSTAASITSTPLKLGTFRMTNTVPFDPCSSPNFTWSFLTAANKTKTAVTTWVNTNASPSSITDPAHAAASFANGGGPQHYVQSNPQINCCPAYATYTNNDPLCFGGLGSAVVTVLGNGANAGTSGTYTVDGGASQSFSSNPFTISGLSTGNHSVVITPGSCPSFTTSIVIGGPTGPLSNSTTATACNSYIWAVNGQTYTQSGTYTGTSTNANGCTVAETLNLSVNYSTSSSTSATACDSYTWPVNGMNYTSSGTYSATSTNAAGCTHTSTLNLTINQTTTSSTSATACDSYTWSVNGMTYTSSGTYTSTSTNTAGCPHISTLNLTINQSTSSTTTATACDSYTWSVNGMTYTQSGTYTNTSTNASGCPHTSTLNLTINQTTTSTTSATACNSYTWSVNGMTYTSSGTYTATNTNASGCTHTSTLNLTINQSTASTTTATACDSYTWSANGMTYTSSGTYTSTSTNTAGCSHISTLNLTINQSTSSTTTATACNSYTWSLNGQTYTASGTYTASSTNASGCPHTSTLNLTINSSTSNSTSATACDSYTWAVNGTTYTTSGTYTSVSTNASGCPHTQTLNLTINNSTTQTTNATACDSYTWSVNGQTYTTSGTYSVASTNAAGCSHTSTLNLTINNSTTATVNETACNSYTWPCNGQTYTQSGTYTCIGTNASGCPSTTTLNLTINSSTSSTTSATACTSYLWSCNNQTYTQSGTYTCTGTNAAGCSHVTTLTLTINNCNVPQTLPYECNIQNIHQVSPTVMEFDIYIKNTGTNSLKLNAFQAGIDFNYTGMAGTGTITGSFVSGSNSLPAPQNNPNWNINATSKQIRLLASVVTSSSSAASITSSPLKLGTFRMTNTVPFDPCSTPNFAWSFVTATNKTKTAVTTWINTGTSPVSITDPAHASASFANGGGPQHYVLSNPKMNCCPSYASYIGTNPICYGGSGSAVVTVLGSGANASTSGTYTVDGGASQNFSSNPFTISGLATGNHTVVITPGTCPAFTTTITISGPTSPATNVTNATACSSYTWAVNGQTYTQSGTYSGTTTNSNGCTVYETLNLTINYPTTSSVNATACNSYTWSCNGQTYTQSGSYTCIGLNAAGCVHTTTLNLTINQSTTSSVSVTACDSYTWSCNGQTYLHSGVYTCLTTNSAGCVHTNVLNLTINPSSISTVNVTACNSYTWACNGQTYTQSGSYTCVVNGTNGCPVTTILNLIINNSTSSSVSVTACDSYVWPLNGTTYNASGTYTHISTNAAGCPHTTTLNLTINHSTASTLNVTACDSYTWSANGTTYTTSGTYSSVSTNAAGCPHTTTLNLTINNSTSSTVSAAACNTYTWGCNGQTYTQSGTYTCMSTNASGCNQTNILNLTINTNTTSTSAITACDSYTWGCNNLTYTQSGTYTCFTTNAAGCLHVAILNLTIKYSTTGTSTVSACNSYTWGCNGQTYTQSGNYICVGLNSVGCTHTTNLALTINTSTSSSMSATACNTYTWGCNGQTYTQSGTYTCLTTNAAGCVHTNILNLTINNSTSSIVTATACNSYTWSCNGQTYTQSGSYTCTSLNTAGCIHTTTLVLTINNTTSSTASAVACNSYTWGCNGQTYTQSGSYTCNTLNSAGCTHINILNLTINNSTSSSISASACNTYTWSCNGQTYTQSGVYTCTGLNSAGCPHTTTLNLTINNSTSTTTNITTCNSYTWGCNGQTYTQSGTYTCSSTNTAGCTQTNILNLTINNSSTNTTAVTACNSYTWSCNGQTYNQSGQYTCIGTNSAGCQLVNILNLTINNSSTSSVNATACNSYTWGCNGQTYTQSGTYTCAGTNTAGCSHITTLNLTINTNTTSTASATACDNYTWSCNGQTYNQSGTYTCTSTNSAGCLHTSFLNLTINSSSTSTMSATACNSYTWNCNGQTYTQSGTYTCNSTNTSGCNNVAVLNLTINTSTSSSLTANACGSYLWSCNNQTYTASGTYSCISTNAAGCTHTTTLNLTINAIPTVTAGTVTTCTGTPVTLIGSPSGGTFNLANPYTGTATSYTYLYTSPQGCSATATGTINYTPAVAITNLAASSITGSGAVITWTSTGVLFDVRYQKVGTTTWINSTSSSSTTRTLSGLTASSAYSVQVRGYCSTTSAPSDWVTITFTTTTAAACATPVTTTTTNITATGAKLNWTHPSVTNNFNVRYRKVGTTTWTTGTASALNKTIAGLTANTQYEYQVQAVCSTTSLSAYSASSIFTTLASKTPGVEPVVEQTTDFNLYPNPTRGMIKAEILIDRISQLQIDIIDMTGRKVKQYSVEAGEGINQYEMDLSDVTVGIYTVRFFQEGKLIQQGKITKSE